MSITIYTIPGCSFCLSTKKWLRDHDLEYQEITVPSEKSKREALDQFSEYFPDDARGVPIIIIRKDEKNYYFNDENDPKLHDLLNIES